jgi:hypothetical protein
MPLKVTTGADAQLGMGLPQPGGQTISGTTPIVQILPGPLSPMLSLDLFSTSTVAGTWLIEASNTFLDGTASDDSFTNTGAWTDITAAFKTPNASTGTAIASPAGSATHQYVEYMGNPGMGFCGRKLRVTFTPTSGAGKIGFGINSSGYAPRG